MIYYNIILLYYIITLYYIILYYIYILFPQWVFISPMGEAPFGSIWDVSTGNLQVFPHVLGEMVNQGCVHPKGAAFFPPLGERLSPSLLERQQATHGEIMGRSWGDHGLWSFFLNWLIYRSCFFFSPEKKYLMVDEHFLHWTGNEHAPLLDKATALRKPCLGKPYLVGGLEHFLFFHISGF